MSSDCHNCGAPRTGASRCGYCGTSMAPPSDHHPLTRDEIRAMTAEARKLRRGLKRPKPPMVELETVWR